MKWAISRKVFNNSFILILERRIMGKKIDYYSIKTYIEQCGYTLLSEKYIDAHSQLLIKCNKGHIINMNWSNFKNGKRCAVCHKEKIEKDSYTNSKKLVENEGYKLLNIVKEKKKTYLICECNKGHEFKIERSHFKERKRCPICSNQKLSFDYVKSSIEKEGYELLSKTYKNVFTPLKLKCDKGHECEINFHDFLTYNKRCGKCKKTILSLGEEEICKELDLLNVKYKRQVVFELCKDKNYLPFDIQVEYNDSIILIEYDGVQHFKSIEHFGGEERLKITQKHDQIKNDFCIRNNIKLIRIPYWEFKNIKTIIRKIFND